jgi:hypothetical protein
MSTPSARQPRGIPVGGQFAPTTHAEPSVDLGAPTVSPDFVAARLEQRGLLEGHVAPYLEQIVERLNESRDFSDPNIIAVADELHTRDHGYTLNDAVCAEEGARQLRATGSSPYADALERILAARSTGTRGRHVNDASGSIPPALYAQAVREVVTVPDGMTEPVPLGDLRLQSGEVFNRVKIHGKVYNHSSVSGYPQDTQAIRLQANRPLTDAEAYALSGVVGYANSSAIGGEPLDDPDVGPLRDTPYSFICSIDTNKGRQGNFEKFEAMLPELIADGSAPRTTKGNTRAIEPFGDPDLKLEIYYAE